MLLKSVFKSTMRTHIKSQPPERLAFMCVLRATVAVTDYKKVLNHHSSKWVFAEGFLPSSIVEAWHSDFDIKLPITA
ncbi:hypothetical protein RKD55_002030 [Rossellomorea marisflavi]